MLHVVEVFFSDHCPGCPAARRVARQFAAVRTDVMVIEHDVTASRAQATRYGLIATPALVIDGTSVFYGVPDIHLLESKVAGRPGPGAVGETGGRQPG